MNSLELILGILGLPLLGGWMLLFAHRSRFAMDRQGRDFGRTMLQAGATIAILHFTFYLFTLGAGLLDPVGSLLSTILTTLARGLIALICLWIGLAARQVARHHEPGRSDVHELEGDESHLSSERLAAFATLESTHELAQREQQFTRLYTLSLVLVGLPLLLPGLLVLLPLSIVLLLEDFLGQNRQVRENRLLWTLALAIQNDRPLSEELRLYALSLSAERQRSWFRRFLGIGKRRARDLNRVISDLSFGIPLGQVLLGTRVLSPDLAASISAAERSNCLKTALPDLATRHTQRIMANMAQDSLFTTLCYVWCISLAAMQIFMFIMYFIIPKYKNIFDDFGVELPWATLRLIQFSNLVQDYWYLLLPLFTLGLGSLLILQRLASGNHQWMRWMLRWFPRMESPLLLNQLGSAISQSAKLPEHLDSLASSEPVDPYRRRLERLQQRVGSGEALSAAMYAEGLITVREGAALNAADRLDHLPWTLHALSRHIQQRRREAFNWLVRLSEPLLILLLGLFALFYCVGMFMPLVKLLSDLS